MNFGVYEHYLNEDGLNFTFKNEERFAELMMEIVEGIKRTKTPSENIHDINSDKNIELSMKELVFEGSTQSFNKNYIALK